MCQRRDARRDGCETAAPVRGSGMSFRKVQTAFALLREIAMQDASRVNAAGAGRGDGSADPSEIVVSRSSSHIEITRFLFSSIWSSRERQCRRRILEHPLCVGSGAGAAQGLRPKSASASPAPPSHLDIGPEILSDKKKARGVQELVS